MEDIANELGINCDGVEQYLNTMTGEFVTIIDSDISGIENDEELLNDIANSRNYVLLPSKYDIHEYSIMSYFAESVQDEGKQNKLFFALDGKGAFRYFKDVLFQNGLEADYYEFRHQAYIDIAQSWCEENDIPYVVKKHY
ncbi:hypothetical protein FACS189449_12090 [Alphaproteobacteria bacterium]|nr:hypothetical protein FACS189449_12090 [Alphaproteobacteria bacterium]